MKPGYAWLQEGLHDGGIVVTANRRLARGLRISHDEAQIAAGKRAWPTARIYTLDDWITRTLENARTAESPSRRLDPYSAAILWERAFLQHTDGQVLGFGGLVRLAVQAWQRIHEWGVPLEVLKSSARSMDERLFVRASRTYGKYLEDVDAEDIAGARRRFGFLLESDALKLPPSLMLAGFQRLPPAVEKLTKQLEDRGCAVRKAASEAKAEIVDVASFTDQDAELRAAGAWARRELQQNADTSLAIVSATLEQDAAKTLRLVREGFVPGWQYGDERHVEAVNISYGQRLADIPLIGVALRSLKWACGGLNTRELSGLLRSEHFGGPEIAARSRLELKTRDVPDRLWRPGDLVRQFGSAADDESSAHTWAACVGALQRFGNLAAQERSPVEWAARIDQVLQEVGWPGIESPGSAEFQLINRWRELLNDLAGIEFVQSRMTLDAAIRRLTTMATDTLYQPEATDGSLQILGKLEAAGLEFDKVWICGMDARNWPASAVSSPLLSRQLQRDYEMPDSTPEDTLKYSRQILVDLAQAASEVRFSWARMDGDAELVQSPLLDVFDDADTCTEEDPGWHAATLAVSDALEVVPDDRVPPVTASEKITGGAYTVQLQSLNPIAAFAAGRLHVSPVARVTTGLSPSVRGSVIHRALRNLYESHPAQAQIREWPRAEREQRISTAVDTALAPELKFADELLERFVAIERKRVIEVLELFLDAEQARSGFTVFEVEGDLDFEKHGVRLGLRLDRMDLLADGSALIIDYKTGAPKNLLNRDGNPVDLQLVVYSCVLDRPVSGLAIVNVDSRAVDYKMVGSQVGRKPLDEQEWVARLARWQEDVDQAIQSLARGDVRVNLNLSTQDSRPLNLLSRAEELRRDT